MSHHDRKRQLLLRLKELGVRLEQIEDELDADLSRDWEEAAVEREDDEVLETLGAAGQAEIARINAALKRIADGTYGICVRCGEEIEPARLDLVPETPLCVKCAKSE